LLFHDDLLQGSAKKLGSLIAAFYLLTRRTEPKSLTALKIFDVESIKETMNAERGSKEIAFQFIAHHSSFIIS
jgi:hypothetical protein